MCLGVKDNILSTLVAPNNELFDLYYFITVNTMFMFCLRIESYCTVLYTGTAMKTGVIQGLTSLNKIYKKKEKKRGSSIKTPWVCLPCDGTDNHLHIMFQLVLGVNVTF